MSMKKLQVDEEESWQSKRSSGIIVDGQNMKKKIWKKNKM